LKAKEVLEVRSRLPAAQLHRIDRSVSARLDGRALEHSNALKMQCRAQAAQAVERLRMAQPGLFNDKKALRRALANEVVESYVTESSNTKNTICSNCNFICHQNCSLSFISEHGSEDFKYCAAFNSQSACQECPNKCPHTTHYHSNVSLKLAKMSVQEILDDEEQEAATAVAAAATSTSTPLPTTMPLSKPSNLSGEMRLIHAEEK
jgi:hypothetical protein